MQRTIVIYGLALATGAFALHWLESQYALRLFSTEIYIVVLAMLFTGVGIWIGARLGKAPAATEFHRNDRVIDSLGLTKKELEVIAALAMGHSNDEMARRLFVSTSTIKSHLVHIYQKLEVSSRTQAIQKSRALQIIP